MLEFWLILAIANHFFFQLSHIEGIGILKKGKSSNLFIVEKLIMILLRIIRIAQVWNRFREIIYDSFKKHYALNGENV